MGVEHRLTAILSADVVGYSRLMAEDEAATIRTLTAYRQQISALVQEYGGRVVDAPGDNLLAELPAARGAVECALEIQRRVQARNAGVSEATRMEWRIGVHMGDVAVEGERIYGDGVNIAARLEALAEPGGICISGAIHDQVQSKLEVEYRDLREQSLKNITRPVHVYRVLDSASERADNRSPRQPKQPAQAAQIRSLAVLPLENLSGDPEQEPLVDGMTDALISDLAKIRSLRVVSRTSIKQYKGADRRLPEIARELKVEGVIEGTVAREGERVRVTVQLIDAREDKHLWAERYDRDVRGVLALQSEVARTVAKQVRLELTPREEAELAGPLGRWFARLRQVGSPED